MIDIGFNCHYVDIQNIYKLRIWKASFVWMAGEILKEYREIFKTKDINKCGMDIGCLDTLRCAVALSRNQRISFNRHSIMLSPEIGTFVFSNIFENVVSDEYTSNR